MADSPKDSGKTPERDNLATQQAQPKPAVQRALNPDPSYVKILGAGSSHAKA